MRYTNNERAIICVEKAVKALDAAMDFMKLTTKDLNEANSGIVKKSQKRAKRGTRSRKA